MHLLTLPTEVRFQIISELLVQSTHVTIEVHFPNGNFRLCHRRGEGFCAALLRVNKQLHHEGTLILYSQNKFHFRDDYSSLSSGTSPHLAPFLLHIGPESAATIRYLLIEFPCLVDIWQHSLFKLHEARHDQSLELIRKVCTNIKTLRLFIPPDHAIRFARDSRKETRVGGGLVLRTLDYLDTQFKAMPSLKCICFDLLLDSKEEVRRCRTDNALMKSMRKNGWGSRSMDLSKNTGRA